MCEREGGRCLHGRPFLPSFSPCVSAAIERSPASIHTPFPVAFRVHPLKVNFPSECSFSNIFCFFLSLSFQVRPSNPMEPTCARSNKSLSSLPTSLLRLVPDSGERRSLWRRSKRRFPSEPLSGVRILARASSAQ